MSRGISFTQAALLYMALYFSCRLFDFLPIMSILIVGICGVIVVSQRSGDNEFSNIVFGNGFLYIIIFITYAGSIYYLLKLDKRYYHIMDNALKYALAFLFTVALYREPREFRKRVWKLCLYGILFTILSTGINVLINPAILRSSASTVVRGTFLFGIGGYDFVYGLIIVNILMIDAIYNSTPEKRKLYWAIFLTGTFTVFVSGYTTAFILNSIFIVIAFLFCGNSKKTAILVLGLPLVGVLPSFLSKILIWLTKVTVIPEIVRERIYKIALSFIGEGEVEHLSKEGERLDRMFRSANLFFEHPILGNFLTNREAAYGEHTEWLDSLAQFGLLGFIFVVLFWTCVYKMQKGIILKHNRKITSLKICYLYFIVLGFLNPATYMGIVFPLIFLPSTMAEFIE